VSHELVRKPPQRKDFETLPLSDVVTITREIGSMSAISFVFLGQNREISE